VFCLTALSLLGLGDRATQGAVKIDTGLMSGAPAAGGATAYLGIPYAALPVGDFRWRPSAAAVALGRHP